ncbi:MAG: hypothetical protein K2K31_03330 [Clostridia bacterium]|nr:hypothetical protein [Clostridia bacterium]
MKKKIFIFMLLFAVTFSFWGCGTSTLKLVKANMSEWTKVYFCGETEDFYCTLNSGVREEDYELNGKSGEVVDFALLVVKFTAQPNSSLVRLLLEIDGEGQLIDMELNTLNNTYMFDLERQLSGTEQISVTLNDQTVDLVAISNDFAVSSDKALEIASAEFEKKILLKKSAGNLNSEFYLRVLDKKANNFDEIFWCFTVYNIDNENYSIIISAETGAILAKSN